METGSAKMYIQFKKWSRTAGTGDGDIWGISIGGSSGESLLPLGGGW